MAEEKEVKVVVDSAEEVDSVKQEVEVDSVKQEVEVEKVEKRLFSRKTSIPSRLIVK